MYGDLDERESLLDELKTSAQPLIDSCDAEIAQQIDAAVQEALIAWNDTRDNLRELKTKYKRATQLWQQYREASLAVKNWADEQMGTISNLQPVDALTQIKVSKRIFVNFFIVILIRIFMSHIGHRLKL